MTKPCNYYENADLFYNAPIGNWKTLVKFKRFKSLAAAVKFAMEDLRPRGHYISIETEETDLDRRSIRALYDSRHFPLKRTGPKRARAPIPV